MKNENSIRQKFQSRKTDSLFGFEIYPIRIFEVMFLHGTSKIYFFLPK